MASDLISRETAIAEIEEYIEEYSELDENGYHNLKWCAMEEAKDVLSMLPAVEAVPVVHAKWDILVAQAAEYRWEAAAECPLCGFMIKHIWAGYFPDNTIAMAREITTRFASKVKLPNYCENCGTKMDGGEA